MDIYHVWFDLKPGVADLVFCDRFEAFMQRLTGDGAINSARLTRKKLGFAPDGFGDFHAMIEVRDLAQLEAAFGAVSARDEPLESEHFGVNSLVQNARFALYRDFPDPQRKRGAEKF